jgi:anti-sigma-K factor RskA
MDRELSIFRDPSFKLLKLQGVPKSPKSVLTVAWSAAKKKVMIDMTNAKMPTNDQDHQYQLWALVGGKPVDLGVFDADTTSTGMKEMKSTALADAFAVTLEPRGGSPSPHLDELVVIGKF